MMWFTILLFFPTTILQAAALSEMEAFNAMSLSVSRLNTFQRRVFWVNSYLFDSICIFQRFFENSFTPADVNVASLNCRVSNVFIAFVLFSALVLEQSVEKPQGLSGKGTPGGESEAKGFYEGIQGKSQGIQIP